MGFLRFSHISGLSSFVYTLNLGAFVLSQAHIYGDSVGLYLKTAHCIHLCAIFYPFSFQWVTVHLALVLKTLQQHWHQPIRKTPAANKQKGYADPCWWSLSLSAVYLCTTLAYDSALVSSLYLAHL